MAGGLESLLAGRTLVKRYRIEEVIGQGGFAVVYRAEDLRLGRPSAVKVLAIPAPTPELREHLRARFEHEARSAAALPHHPNVVPVYDFGTDAETGIDFIVMELLRGENVAEYLSREGRPPLPLAMRILRDATEGIAVGHRNGLIHRDVKPGNIFLAEPQGDQPFRVCVLDFGIARVTGEDDDGSMTRTRGAAPLSPAYASPEQLRGDRNMSPAADVYSLGVVGYQLLTGRKPFNAERDAGTSTELRPAREFNPQVSPAMEAVIARAMHADPAHRFADADELASALDAAMEPDDSTTLVSATSPIIDDERTVIPAAAPRRAPIAAAVSGGAPVAAPAPPPPAAPPRRRKRRGWMVALPVLALAGAAGLWAMNQEGGEPAERPDPADTAEARAATPPPASQVPVTTPLPPDLGGAQPMEGVVPGGEAPVEGGYAPVNPNPGGGSPAPSQPAPSQPTPRPGAPAPQPRQPAPAQPAPRRSDPAPRPRQAPQPAPRPAPPRPQPQPELPPQREAPRQPLPSQPQPAPLPPPVLPGRPVPQPPPPTTYPAPPDTIFIPSVTPQASVAPQAPVPFPEMP